MLAERKRTRKCSFCKKKDPINNEAFGHNIISCTNKKEYEWKQKKKKKEFSVKNSPHLKWQMPNKQQRIKRRKPLKNWSTRRPLVVLVRTSSNVLKAKLNK
jgi:hypothetical protein